MVNKETGLTQAPSHPRVLGIHARPRMQVSLGQFRYFPAVERLKTSPKDIPIGNPGSEHHRVELSNWKQVSGK